MIHSMAETYGKLPSEVLDKGDTFDMMVFDVVQTLKDYHNKKKDKKGDLNTFYDKDDLAKGIERMRNK